MQPRLFIFGRNDDGVGGRGLASPVGAGRWDTVLWGFQHRVGSLPELLSTVLLVSINSAVKLLSKIETRLGRN